MLDIIETTLYNKEGGKFPDFPGQCRERPGAGPGHFVN